MAYAIMPLFRVPRHACRNYQFQTTDGKLIAIVEKYRFAVLPIQDPRTLLDRLNTRRLRGRIKLVKHQLKREDRESDDVNGNYENSLNKLNELCYQYGRTIEELAYEEWAMMEIDHANDLVNHNNGKTKQQWRIWPAHLELIRFLENDCSGNVCHNNNTQKQRRSIISSPSFRLRGLSSNAQLEGDNEGAARSNKIFGKGISLLASYPRSGNTLLRTLLERSTSIVTGSDTRPDRTLSRSLAMEHDLVGEGLVGANCYPQTNTKSNASTAYDPPVHIVKTHFPERKGWKPVKGDRVLLLVRNPYDAIDSYWNLCCTNTHTQTLDEAVYTKYAQKFEGLARHEIQIWCEFHYYWIDTCEKEGVPLLVVRYEDLVLNTEAEMLRVIKFLMDDDSQLTSFWK